MGVYKEMGYLVRKIQNKSKQIYPDAADHGVPIYDYSDPLISMTKGIMDMYGINPKTKNYGSGATQSFRFDGGWPAVFQVGFESAEVVFVSTPCEKKKSGMLGYLYAHTSTSAKARSQAQSYGY